MRLHGNVEAEAGGGADMRPLQRVDQCVEPARFGAGVGVHEYDDFVGGIGAFDGGELVVDLLAARFGEAGDDDLHAAAAVLGDDLFQELHHRIGRRFDGEEETVGG